MTFPQIKKLLAKASKEAEDRALEDGVDVTTPEFKDVLRELRDSLLSEWGYTPEEYEDYLESLKDIGRRKKQAKEDELEDKLELLRMELEAKIPEQGATEISFDDLADKPQLLTKDEVSRMIAEAVAKFPKPESRSFVKIERPVTQVTERVEYDASALEERINSVSKLIEDLKPADIDVEAIKEDLKGHFGETFKQNIDTLGMPDFRKLAMGLRAEIDELRGIIAGSTSGGINSETPTPAADGSTMIFTVTNRPKFLIVDEMSRVEGLGYTLTGSGPYTITIDSLVTPPNQILSIY